MMSQIIEKWDLPPVCINLLTKDRTDYAVATVKNCLDKLKYEGNLVWYISDGGSSDLHYDQVRNLIPEPNLRGYQSHGLSPGESWNIGLKRIFGQGIEIYLRLEDDMVLKTPMDITTWVKLLMTQESIGMIRLGMIVQDLDLETIKFPTYTHVGYTEEIYLHVKKTRQYAFSGNPALIHKRFHDAYGGYPTGLSPGETELAFDSQIRSKDGPMIVFPWDMGKYGTWGNWDHIGKEKSE